MAFVHLHNHSDFSILDAATRVSDMVKRAVDLGMPALALTDHGYMFGIPDFDMECRRYNDAQKDMGQWRHDVECFQKGWELEEPEPDAPDAAPHDRVHAQWASDVLVWEQTHDLEGEKGTTYTPIAEVYDSTSSAQGDLFGWFGGLAGWCVPLFSAFMLAGFIAMLAGEKWEQERDSRLLGRSLRDWKEP